MQFTPYLTFDGKCKEAFEFYAKALGGKIEAMISHAEAPPEMQGDAAWRDRIMHARLSVGDGVLMGGDAPVQFFSKPAGFSVQLAFDTVEEGKTVFDALSEGGEVRMPFGPTFWAKSFGMLIDKYGTPWMVNAGMQG